MSSRAARGRIAARAAPLGKLTLLTSARHQGRRRRGHPVCGRICVPSVIAMAACDEGATHSVALAPRFWRPVFAGTDRASRGAAIPTEAEVVGEQPPSRVRAPLPFSQPQRSSGLSAAISSKMGVAETGKRVGGLGGGSPARRLLPSPRSSNAFRPEQSKDACSVCLCRYRERVCFVVFYPRRGANGRRTQALRAGDRFRRANIRCR
jgi:hypothetical protein